MPTSTVIVRQNGRPLSGARVVLEWNGLANLGMSRPAFTNNEGMAIISHASTGPATIYVNGQRKQKMRTPGDEVVVL